jgi:hypothetical protein
MTERETESYLVLETRSLPMPNGNQRPTTCMHLVWSSLDVVTLASNFDEARVVELAHISTAEMGTTFEDAFQAVVAYLHKEIDQRDSGLT